MTLMPKYTFRGLLLATSVISAGAHAEPLFPELTDKDCSNFTDKKGGQVDNEKLRAYAIKQAGLIFTPQLANEFVVGRLGNLAQEANNCVGDACKKFDPNLSKLRELRNALLPLDDADMTFSDPTNTSERSNWTFTKNEKLTLARKDLSIEFLNGDWKWLSAQCTIKNVQPPSKPPATGENPVAAKNVAAPKLIIAKNEDDIGVADLSDRGFASLSLSIDRIKSKESWKIDALAALDGPILSKDGKLSLLPYVGFQYDNDSNINDLTFGSAVRWQPGRGDLVFFAKGAYETDSDFKSAVWRGSLDALIVPVTSYCYKNASRSGSFYTLCSVKLVSDFQRVSNAGKKSALADLKNILRAGIDAEFTFHKLLSGDKGQFSLQNKLSYRGTIDGDTADALLYFGSLGYSPGKASNWKFSLDYQRGKDITSLENQDKITVSVGFRY